MEVNQRAGFKNDPVYLERLNAQSAAPLDYRFATRFSTGCALPRSVYDHCTSSYRPGGALVDRETALRFGEPFDTYDPMIPVANVELYDRSPLMTRAGMDVGLETSLRLAPPPIAACDVRRRGEIGERFGTVDLFPPDQVPICMPLVQPRFGESTRVVAKNQEYWRRTGGHA
jgi:hypothetical protein